MLYSEPGPVDDSVWTYLPEDIQELALCSEGWIFCEKGTTCRRLYL